jgi:predicted house-cleaning noncanonical NTP pyrophosphatase (MazG superfamily)
MKKYNKLVRDKIVDIILKNKKQCNYRIAKSDEEYEKYLKLKLIEEVHEFLEEPCPAEVGDILDVLDTMMTFYGIDPSHMESDRIIKKEARGVFDKKIILESVE